MYLLLFSLMRVTNRGGHEAIAVEGHVVVSILGHLRLLISHAAQSAGGAGVLLAATLSLYCQNSIKTLFQMRIIYLTISDTPASHTRSNT